jgi:branched-chain amino acid transport system permease protein
VPLLGGVGSLWGPVIGAVVLVPLAEGLNGELGDVLPGIQGVVYGVAIILIILGAPEGVYWRLRDRFPKSRSAPLISPEPVPAVARSDAQPTSRGDLLVLRGVGISFGGLRAVRKLSTFAPLVQTLGSCQYRSQWHVARSWPGVYPGLVDLFAMY